MNTLRLFVLLLFTGLAPAALAGDTGKDASDQMQQQMRLMQSQMEKIANTRDPKERQRLLEEHGATMRDAMATMQGSRGGMMGGCMPMHQMMMEQMMDQMSQHQHWMMQAPTAPKK
jgi:hypothetical protein